jgi:hypothetical protein
MRGVSPPVAFGINSALAFACAELMTAALHEAGHGLVAQRLGFSPHIYAFYERNPDGTAAQHLMILAAGPLTSLVLGTLFLIAFARGRAHYSFPRLLLLWLGWLGVLEFVNYLIVTPWLPAGDTAQIAKILGWSMLERYCLAALGIALVFLLARRAAATMLAVAPQQFALGSPVERRRYVRNGFFLPLLAGVALTALGGLGSSPSYVALGLLGTLGNIDIVSAAVGASTGAPPARERAEDAPLRIEPLAVGLFAALVILYVTVFSRGMPI